MLTPDQLLRQENEDLRYRIADLERQLGWELDVEEQAVYRRVFKVRPGPARILQVLMRARTATKESLFSAYVGDSLNTPEIQIIDVFVHNLRPSLKLVGARIETIYGVGYWIPSEDKATIRRVVDGHRDSFQGDAAPYPSQRRNSGNVPGPAVLDYRRDGQQRPTLAGGSLQSQ